MSQHGDGAARQERLRSLLITTQQQNPFYARKLTADCADRPFDQVPFTTKAELVADQAAHPPYGSNLTLPAHSYSRVHQTSGTTTGKPLRWLDTAASWQWLLDCWLHVFAGANIGAGERLFFPFSFGPFLGFWAAFDAAARAGWFCVPGGGMSSVGRLRHLLDHQCTVVCCTPTYAMHLAEVAQHEGISLRDSSVHTLIVAGEPGGNIPSTRERIAEAWQSRIIDHYGLTEVGPVAVEPVDQPGYLVINHDQFIAEVIEPGGDRAVAFGELGELVLTNLGRTASPLIRYRTGDLVRPVADERGLFRLQGGILGRTDDMIHLRGNNLYPSAVEAVIRRHPEVVEFRITVREREALATLLVEVEPMPECSPENAERLIDQLTRSFRDELLFRADIRVVPTGTLPRFEMKAKRFRREN